jgi:hypothetical protein
MIVLALVMVIIVVVLLAHVLSQSQESDPPLDSETAMRAAVELHRIHRDLDVEWTKRELRQDAARLEHRIVEIIDGDDEP